MGDSERGLYRKFTVLRTDGKDFPGKKHCGCEYFVLDLTHDSHAIAAIRAYAESCKFTYPQLSRELRSKLDVMEERERHRVLADIDATE